MNWFRKADGKFIWPGFGDNSRVLEWIFDRTGNADNGEATPVGILPKAGRYNFLFIIEDDSIIKLVSTE